MGNAPSPSIKYEKDPSSAEHEHPLTFIDKDDDDDSVTHFCQGCQQWFSGPSYYCEKCFFYLHKSCGELPPEIQHFFHPCKLILVTSRSFFCKACCKERSGFTYRCSKCSFFIDVSCASLPTLISEDGEKHIHHFSHGHPLTLVLEKEARCRICGELCAGPIYECSICSFNVHKTCLANLPQKIEHFFHDCPLTLATIKSYRCRACQTSNSGLSFHCSKCNFDLDVECAVTALTRSEDHDQIQHTSHGHPLVLIENTEVDDLAYCAGCGKSCSQTPNYCCKRCNFWLHKSCVELPLEIQHFFHPCSLRLCDDEVSSQFQCHACNKSRSGGFKFYCGQCSFDLDVECALLPDIISAGQEQIVHLGHGHPLTLYAKMKGDHEACCNICRKTCLGPAPAYACNLCNFSLHKSCAQLKRIHHLSHPSCSLVLVYQNQKVLHIPRSGSNPLYPFLPWHHKQMKNDFFFVKKERSSYHSCSLCFQNLQGLFFSCGRCEFFHLCPGCASSFAAVKYEDHEHHLIFLEKMQGACSNCNSNFSSSPGFCCLRCDFRLHLLCGPLPCTIKLNECHPHPLFLKDFYVERDDDDEFYCDACEDRRDVRQCVYSCRDCLFISDVNCVMSEVIASLKGERGVVELRTVGRQICGKVITKDLALKEMEHDMKIEPTLILEDMINSFSETEKQEIEGLAAILREKHSTGQRYIEGQTRKDGLDSEEHKNDFVDTRQSPLAPYNYKFKRRFGFKARSEYTPNFLKEYKKEFHHRRQWPLTSNQSIETFGFNTTLESTPNFLKEDGSEEEDFLYDWQEQFEFDTELESAPILPKENRKYFHQRRRLPLAFNHSKEQFGSHGRLESTPIFLDQEEEEEEEEEEVFLDNRLQEQLSFVRSFGSTPIDLLEEHKNDFLDNGDCNPCSEDAFNQLIEKLDSDASLKCSPHFLEQHKNDFVDNGDHYMIPRMFIPITKDLFARYGDISENSMSSPRVRSIYFFISCGVIQSMRMTRITDITEDVLHQWWWCIKSVELYGNFKIQFMKNHLKRVVEAYFGLEATKFTGEQAREIERISEEIEQLRRDKEAIEEERKRYVTFIDNETTDIMTQCFSDALAMKWKPAADGLL